MPTILRIGPYRFFFYSSEDGEPIHVHVIRDKAGPGRREQGFPGA